MRFLTLALAKNETFYISKICLKVIMKLYLNIHNRSRKVQNIVYEKPHIKKYFSYFKI